MNIHSETTQVHKPIAVVIGALGGQGGGVLTDWIVTAAIDGGLPTQSTSVPGVAQRTGATTYYIEVLPTRTEQHQKTDPVLALYPCAGEVDIVIATELLEAGRAIERGYVSTDKTALIASTHREYSISEKMDIDKNLYDSSSLIEAIETNAKNKYVSNFLSIAQNSGGVLNAVLLGILSESGLLPISEQNYRKAITASEISVKSNLAGFDAGIAFVRDETPPPIESIEQAKSDITNQSEESAKSLNLPSIVTGFVALSIDRLTEFQDQAYAREYTKLVCDVHNVDCRFNGKVNDYALTNAFARSLSRIMCYGDVIQVARSKCDVERYQRIRAEVGIRPDSVLQVTEFLKPGRDEFASIMPKNLVHLYQKLFASGSQDGQSGISLRIKSHTVFGFSILRFLAGLRFLRRRSGRFAEEAALRERWCSAILAAASINYENALQIVKASDLLRGYGDTYRSGRAKFDAILQDVTIDPKSEISKTQM